MILNRYLDYVEDTEPPTQFHRWAFISACSAMLQRRVYLPFGHGVIYPNQYVMLVGPPGTRKSSSINIVKDLVEGAEYDKFSFTKTSKQKFLIDWADATELGGKTLNDMLDAPIVSGETVGEIFCCLDEFIDFIGVNNFDFISLLTTLWDCLPKYDERLKNSVSVSIHKPTVNLLGGITPTSLAMAVPSEANGQGFFSRFIMVHAAKNKKKITFPTPPDPKDKELFNRFFRQLQTISGEAQLTDAAKDAVDKIYHKWENNIDVKLEYYSGRRLTHLFKLIMTLAAIENKLTVDRDVVVHANTILCYTELSMAKALSEFGSAKNLASVSKVIEILEAANGPVTSTELWSQASSYFDKISDLMTALQGLTQAKKIRLCQEPAGSVELITSEPIEFGDLVDYEKYIREYEPTQKVILK